MYITDERYTELQTMFADATLDNALDAIEWLVYVQDFAKLDKSVEDTIEALQEICQITPQYSRDVCKVKPFDRIFQMFAKAKEQGLDWPKIQLGGELNLTLAMNAKGIINLTNGQRYGTPGNVWYGRISPPNGTVCANLDIRDNQPAADKDTVQQMLQNFDTDPASTAKMYGHQTGKCMFCARKLTNETSVKVGYGPICAENFNLPHGEHP